MGVDYPRSSEPAQSASRSRNHCTLLDTARLSAKPSSQASMGVPSPALAASLPKPGEILRRDYRTPSVKAEVLARPASAPIRMVQWNIERGYKLDAVIDELKHLNADVLALQEIDIHCERSAWEDTGVRIAEALGLNYAFLCEFEELHSPLRDASSQGGGVHGNAILSKFEFSDLEAIEHTCHPVDWEAPTHPLAMREPRHGRRLTLAGVVHSNQGPLLLYTAHLECFCGMLARMHQFSDILRHAKKHSHIPHQAILGDLNTLANGVARLSPNYCNDWMRFLTLGWFEAEIWDHCLLRELEDPAHPDKINAWAARMGLPKQVCLDLVNPGFKDPFDTRKDITLDVPKYRILGMHLMTGKLDWVLLRNIQVLSKCMGNDQYDRSDHKWLQVEVNLQAPAPTANGSRASHATTAIGAPVAAGGKL